MKNFGITAIVAGGLAAAALGLAGHAAADAGDDNTGSYTNNSGSYSFVASPTVYARPATTITPWGAWVEQGNNNANQWQALAATAANP